MAKPVNGPKDEPMTAMTIPISSGFMAPRDAPLFSSPNASIANINTAVITNSTPKAPQNERAS